MACAPWQVPPASPVKHRGCLSPAPILTVLSVPAQAGNLHRPAEARPAFQSGPPGQGVQGALWAVSHGPSGAEQQGQGRAEADTGCHAPPSLWPSDFGGLTYSSRSPLLPGLPLLSAALPPSFPHREAPPYRLTLVPLWALLSVGPGTPRATSRAPHSFIQPLLDLISTN